VGQRPTRIVNLAKLKKQLEREAKRNPKQAAVLGLLFAVALWFWAPLVLKWLPIGHAGAEADMASAAVPTSGTPAITPPSSSSTTTTSPAAAPVPATASWKQVAEWIESDHLMTPATGVAAARDPFRTYVDPTAKQAEIEQPVAKVGISPSSLGMTVSSIIYGSRRRIAMIDGTPYAEGRRVMKQAAGQTIVFRIVEIHPRHVVLERDGEQYQLHLVTAALAATDDEE